MKNTFRHVAAAKVHLLHRFKYRGLFRQRPFSIYNFPTQPADAGPGSIFIHSDSLNRFGQVVPVRRYPEYTTVSETGPKM